MPGVIFLIVVPTANFEQEILNGKPLFLFGIRFRTEKQ